MLSFLLLSACTGNLEIDSGGETGKGDTADTEDTGGGGDGVSPVVLEITTSFCEPNTDGEDTWSITATVTDPQGDDTFTLGRLYIYLETPSDSNEPVADEPMICAAGECTTGWEDLTGKAGCELAGKVWMRILVTDDDDNVSEPYDFQPTA